MIFWQISCFFFSFFTVMTLTYRLQHRKKATQREINFVFGFGKTHLNCITSLRLIHYNLFADDGYMLLFYDYFNFSSFCFFRYKIIRPPVRLTKIYVFFYIQIIIIFMLWATLKRKSLK